MLSSRQRPSGAFPVKASGAWWRGCRGRSILHVCGDASHLIEEIGATGILGVSLDGPVSLSETAGKLPPTLVIGHLDPVEVFFSSTRKESAAILARCWKRCGVIHIMWPHPVAT